MQFLGLSIHYNVEPLNIQIMSDQAPEELVDLFQSASLPLCSQHLSVCLPDSGLWQGRITISAVVDLRGASGRLDTGTMRIGRSLSG